MSALKPREKARRYGLAALADVELLALFLRTGYYHKEVSALALDLITLFGSLKAVVEAPLSSLETIKGLGPVKALEIKALGELILRVEQSPIHIIDSPSAALAAISSRVDWDVEQFFILLLDREGRLLYMEVMYSGTRARLNADPQEIIALALKFNARKFYCLHNHPSGELSASLADTELTQQITVYAALFRIIFLAHIVFNEQFNYSTIVG